MESLLSDNKLVSDGQGAAPAKGRQLQLGPQGNEESASQLWLLVAASENRYDPKITGISPTIINQASDAFIIGGTGFQPGTQVIGGYSYVQDVTENSSSGTFVTTVDLGGEFVSVCGITVPLSEGKGLLQVQVYVSFPSLPSEHGLAAGLIQATWNGGKFVIGL
jgi:hypothetical protein